MRVLYAATANRGKLEEFRAAAAEYPDLFVEPLPGLAALPVCPEDGATFEENARKKALHYSAFHPGLVFADDSGLEVQALGGEPGVFSARYAAPNASDEQNNHKLLAALAGVPQEKRNARFVCVIALARREKILATSTGSAEGRIIDAPRGSGGFGYDPLFLLPELNRTFAELSPQEKLRYSHRGRAFRELLRWVRGANVQGPRRGGSRV